MIENLMRDVVEDYLIANFYSKRLDLISDILICTYSSLNLLKRMPLEQLESTLQECDKARHSQSDMLNNIGFNIKSRDMPSMVKLKVGSNHVFVNKLDPFGKMLSIHGGHEFITLKVLSAMVGRNDTYVEIGVNYGDFLLVISEIVNFGGKVYGFEPSTTVFKYLQASAEVSKYQNIVLENKAVSNKNGFVTFEMTDLVEGFNSLGSAIQSESDNYSSAKGIREVQVQSVILDDYFNNNNIIPNLIRLDIEGSECKALKGLQHTLNQYKPNLSVEFQPALLKKYESDSSIKKCLATLYDNYYDVRDLHSFQSLDQDSIIDYYNKNQDTELVCIYDNQQLVEELQNSIYANGGWSHGMQETGDL